MLSGQLGTSEPFEVTRLKEGKIRRETVRVATEVPFTIVANDVEIATLLCTPADLKELAYGFLFTSGFIRTAGEVIDFAFDSQKWRGDLKIEKMPDPKMMGKRLYTSGCGKGVVYSSIMGMALRHRLDSSLVVERDQVNAITQWLQTCSDLYKATGGVHAAALSVNGAIPLFPIDDVGRHNAVDKVIGKALLDGRDFSQCLIASTGRTSSEILFKAKRAGIAIVLSRGSPTHQAVLLAREMDVTVVGFARGGGFTVYAGKQRISFSA